MVQVLRASCQGQPVSDVEFALENGMKSKTAGLGRAIVVVSAGDND